MKTEHLSRTGNLIMVALPDYRLVRKNGALVLQRAYGWANGTDGGVEWEDEPTIDFDEPKTNL